MTKAEKKEYENKRPIAVLCDSNWGGVEILDIISGLDYYVVARYNYGEPGNLHRVKVHFGENVESFRIGNRTFDLNDFLRV